MVEKRDRKKHAEKQSDEPWVDWTRMRFPGTPSGEKRSDMELEAEFETDGDLLKPIPQLVCDFNFEVQRLSTGATEQRILLTAQSRMVAMMAQVAMKNDKVSDQIADLTRWLVRLTVVIAILTLATGVIPFLFNK